MGRAGLASGGPAPKGPKGLGIWDLRPLAIPSKEVGEILKNVKVKCAKFRSAVLDCPIGIDARPVYKVKWLALSSVSKSGLRFLRTQARG